MMASGRWSDVGNIDRVRSGFVGEWWVSGGGRSRGKKSAGKKRNGWASFVGQDRLGKREDERDKVGGWEDVGVDRGLQVPPTRVRPEGCVFLVCASVCVRVNVCGLRTVYRVLCLNVR